MKFTLKGLGGFTLAEVLIVIAVIGVIAAMTIPTLIRNSQKLEYIVTMKKCFSTFQNGIKTYISNMDCSDLPCTGLFNGAESTNPDKLIEFAKIFRGLRDAGSEYSTLKSKSLSGAASYNLFNANYLTLQMVDGSIYNIVDSDPNNCDYNSADTTDSKLKSYCASITVDINGPKNPNIVGRDVYTFILSRDGFLYPILGTEYAKTNPFPNMISGHWPDDPNYCGNETDSVIPDTATGFGCAARIMEQGWEMKY